MAAESGLVIFNDSSMLVRIVHDLNVKAVVIGLDTPSHWWRQNEIASLRRAGT